MIIEKSLNSFAIKLYIFAKKVSITLFKRKNQVSQHYAHNPFFRAGALFLKSRKVFGKSFLDKNKCPKSESRGTFGGRFFAFFKFLSLFRKKGLKEPRTPGFICFLKRGLKEAQACILLEYAHCDGAHN